MAVTAKMYDTFPESCAEKKVDVLNDTIKCALFTSAVAPTQADANVSGLTQVSQANGYTTGGVAVGSPTSTVAGHVWTLNAADPAWTVTGAGFSYRYAVFYADLATDVLISYVDFGADVTAAAGTHTIVLDAAGIVTVTAA